MFHLFTPIGTQSGLTQACLESPHSREFVASEVLRYIKKWIPHPRIGVLAGSSVHVDRTFLVAEMPEVAEWLHYRLVFASCHDDFHPVDKLVLQNCWFVP